MDIEEVEGMRTMVDGVTQLGYVGIGVSDLDAWERFGTQLLGLELAERSEDRRVFRMDDRASRIITTRSTEDDLIFNGWQVPDGGTLAAVAQRLEAAGHTLEEATDEELAERGVRAMFWLKDPDGLRTEVFYAPTRCSDPFRPGRAMSGFKAGDQGLGHVVVRVEDRDRAEAFYTQLLGLGVSDYGSGRLAFLHCNPRHHSIALAPRHLIPGPKRLVHVMLEVTTIDDVGTAMDLCDQLGYFIPEKLGRHTNDQMLSFYIESPSGFQIEYGYGAREVQVGSCVVQSYDRKDVWGHQRVSK